MKEKDPYVIEELGEHLREMVAVMVMTLVLIGVFIGFPVPVLVLCAGAIGLVVTAAMVADVWEALRADGPEPEANGVPYVSARGAEREEA